MIDDVRRIEELWELGASARMDAERRERYYAGRHAILDREATWADGTAKANIVTNWAKYAVDLYKGAMTTAPFQVSAREGGEDADGAASESTVDPFSYYSDVADQNALHAIDVEMLRQALTIGYGVEMHEYREDKDGKPYHRITASHPREWQIVYDWEGEPAFAVRRVALGPGQLGPDGEILMDDLEILTAWDKAEWRQWTRGGATGADGAWTLRDGRPHYFGRPPIVVWTIDEMREPILTDDLIGQIDEYNEIDSCAGDNIRDIVDAILTVKADPSWLASNAETIRNMRMVAIEESGDVGYVVRPSNTEPVKTRLDRSRKQICMIAGVPDITDMEGATGSTSGIALRLRFMSMQHRASGMMHHLRDAVRQRIDLINALALKLRKPAITAYDVGIQFVLPHNRTEEWTAIGALKDIVSHRTQLKLLSDIEDPESELSAVMNEAGLTPEAAEAATARVAALMTPFAEEALNALSVAVIDALKQSGALARVASDDA